MSPAWLMLIAAGLLEIVWAVAMKYSNGWTRLKPSILTLVAMLASFYLLSRAMKDLPAGTAYAAWVGIGAVGVALYGMLHLGEPATTARLLCLVLIVGGVVGLKVLTPTNHTAPPTPFATP